MAWNPRQAAEIEETELAILATMAQDLGLAVESSGDPQSRERARLAVATGFGLPEHTLADLPKASANLIRIVQGSERPVFQGDIVFVAAEGTLRNRPEGPQSWRRHVSGTIDDHSVACDHFEMMTPGPAADIGSLLSARIGA
jgi:thioesterase domain-containing protein